MDVNINESWIYKMNVWITDSSEMNRNRIYSQHITWYINFEVIARKSKLIPQYNNICMLLLRVRSCWEVEIFELYLLNGQPKMSRASEMELDEVIF